MMSSSGFMLTMAVAACVLMLGGILAMLYLRQRSQVSAGSQGELEKELREQLASARNTVEELRQQLDTERSGKTQAEARLEAAETYRKEQDRLHEKHLIDLKADHTKALEELKESFRALSHEALKETHPVFLQLAKESFAGLQAIAHLLAAAGTGNERRRHLVRTCSIQLRRVHARNLGRARGAKIGNKMRLWRLHWILGVWRVHLCTRCMSVVPRREMLLHDHARSA